MKSATLLPVVLCAIAGIAQAENLCAINPYRKDEAAAGKVAFDSHCALCHQYSMKGREPGNYANESPDMKLLSEADLQFIDGGSGRVPPLIGPVFMARQKGKSLVEFTSTVSGAANTFPPAGKLEIPKTYLQIAAYVLYRNCGKM